MPLAFPTILPSQTLLPPDRNNNNTGATSMQRGIYAVIDTRAEDILGVLQIFKHEAAAVRFFGDIATMANSQIAIHPTDYELVRLGWVSESAEGFIIVADRKTILTGSTWAAAQRPASPENQ